MKRGGSWEEGKSVRKERGPNERVKVENRLERGDDDDLMVKRERRRDKERERETKVEGKLWVKRR